MKRTFLTVLTGAILSGFLWRLRGSNGWGAAWGLLFAGFLFALFLTAALPREKSPSVRLVSLTAFSFMLTAPAWGTLLQQITGVLGGLPEGAEPVYVSPVSGVVFMLLMGFGLAAVYGVLLGRCFSEKAWRLRDYIVLLAVFFAVLLAAQASVSHPLVRLLQPQAARAFEAGLAETGVGKTAYGAYLAHFASEGWAKKIPGGRHYFACVSAVSTALAAAGCILTARFYVKDRFSARTGAFVCGAFAVSITLADLFFFFSAGGYHGAQGFSLPANFAAWSLWEYFTGFLAGGAVTLYLLRRAAGGQTRETLLSKLPEKGVGAVTFLLCCAGAFTLNAARPVLRRLRDTPAGIPLTAAAAVISLAFCLILCRVFGFSFEKAHPRRLPALLCGTLLCWSFFCYLFIGAPEIADMDRAHNVLAAVSFAFCEAACIRLSVKKPPAAAGPPAAE